MKQKIFKAIAEHNMHVEVMYMCKDLICMLKCLNLNYGQNVILSSQKFDKYFLPNSMYNATAKIGCTHQNGFSYIEKTGIVES